MLIPGVFIETLQNPILYSREQIDRACFISGFLNRGKFVLVEAPRGKHATG